MLSSLLVSVLDGRHGDYARRQHQLPPTLDLDRNRGDAWPCLTLECYKTTSALSAQRKHHNQEGS